MKNFFFVALIFLQTALYCNRFYGNDFRLEGDAPQNVYFRLHQDLVEADHDPHFSFFWSYFPIHGLYNPLIWAGSALVRAFGGSQLEPLSRAIFELMVGGWLGMAALASSAFFFFLFMGVSRWGSLLACNIVTFTGFHLIGFREFNLFYLLSFACLFPVLYCLIQIWKEQRVALHILIGGLALGVSLWGGNNAPMFYFLPFAWLVAIVDLKRNSLKPLAMFFAHGIFLASIGIFVGAVTLLPGLLFAKETMRNQIGFHLFNGPRWESKGISLLLRDWWTAMHPHFHEQDNYLGVTVTVLLICGVGTVLQRRRALTYFDKLMGALGAVALFMVLLPAFPTWFQWPVKTLFLKLSIRFPERFFMLLLIPIAYFASKALDRKPNRVFLWGTNLALTLLTLSLLNHFVFPENGLLPDLRVAALYSVTLGVLANVVLLLWERYGGRGLLATCVFLIFLGFYFAPIPLTVYPTTYLGYYAQLHGKWPSDRLGFLNFSGLDSDYSVVVEQARAIFQDPPESLKAINTREGRIYFDAMPFLTTRPNLYAAHTGHHFIFDNQMDTTRSRRFDAILKQVRPKHWLDLGGVCWVLEEDGTVRHRPSCFPTAFFVPQAEFLAGSALVIERMKQSKHHDFLSRVFIDCSEAQCPSQEPALTPRSVVSATEGAGRLSYEITEGSGGYLFISAPFRSDWKATINGQETPVLVANGGFMSVALRPGKNQIEMELTREVPLWGERITFTALVLVLSGLFGLWIREIRLTPQLSHDRSTA